MIIDEGDDEGQPDAAVDVAGTAYRENITSVDGFTRGANGRVKFNKDTKKRRRDNADVDGDVEMGDGEAGPGRSKKAKRPAEPKFGHEFKAKVCDLQLRLDCRLDHVSESWWGRQEGRRGPVCLHVLVPGGQKEQSPQRKNGDCWETIVTSLVHRNNWRRLVTYI